MIFRCLRGFFRNCHLKMSSSSHLSLLPDNVRGMKQLDREKFSCNIKVAVLKLLKTKLYKIRLALKPYILKLEKFKPLQHLNEPDQGFDCLIYLNPEKVMCWTDISEEDRKSLKNLEISEANLEVKELQITYENFKYEDIFKKVLPEDQEKVSGFSQIGHIIHLNLRYHLLEYKSLIGAVLLDKIANCRTVINKSDFIDNTFRNFNMEVIAGEEDFLVTVREHHCNFQFDFSKVYWNPRLGIEHGRVLDSMAPNDVLFDVFCGVGPFAVPAAKKNCKVFANDLNPDSYKWLNINAKQNKVNMNLFKSYNLDGKDFICNIFKNFIVDCCKGIEIIPAKGKIHMTMNLPGKAVEFLKYFNGLIDDAELIDKFNFDVIAYVYCFTNDTNTVKQAKQMVVDNIKQDVSLNILDIFHVRNVSPKKEMMKVTLRLSKEILFGLNNDPEFTEPPSKKLCVESASAVSEGSECQKNN